MSLSTDYSYDFYTNHELIQKKDAYIKKGLCGLVNLGNKCFMNSTLQCLSNTLKLTDYFLSNKHIEDDPDKNNRKKQEYFLVLSYVNLMINVWESNQLIRPKSFVENLSKFIKKYYSLDQQDAHECLLHILEIMHKGLSYEIEVDIKGEVQNKTDELMKKSLESWKSYYEKSYSVIIDTFNGLLYNKIVCSNCNQVEDVFEPYNTLSLDIPIEMESFDLKDCLQETLQKKESISTWNCEKCKKDGCSKECCFWTIPNYLIIHLKRFRNNGKKVNTHVKFPLEDLNLTEFVSNDKSDPNNYIYSLYSVNYHSGDLNSGHYWACCRNLDNNWYLFNDGHVSKFHNVNEIMTKDAYMLFYYRKFIKKPIQI